MPKKLTPDELKAMQSESTRRILDRDPSLDESWFFRAVPESAKVTQEDIDSGRVAGPKDMSIEEQKVAWIARTSRSGTQGKNGTLEGYGQGTKAYKQAMKRANRTTELSYEENKPKAESAFILSYFRQSVSTTKETVKKVVKKTRDFFKVRVR